MAKKQAAEAPKELPKAFSFDFSGSDLVIKVDSNRDGQPILELKIALAEIPDEVFDRVKKAKKLS